MTGIEYNRRLESIPVYPAADSYAFDGDLVKLASNETPWGPIPAVLEKVQEQLGTLNRYPDPDKSALRRAIADRCDIAPARVAVGNGSCEILLAAAEALLEPGAEMVYAWPSFSMYPHMAAQSGATRDHRAGRRRGPVTTSTRWRVKSRPRRASCWSATPTTRPRPRCRWTRSTRSWPSSRATWR